MNLVMTEDRVATRGMARALAKLLVQRGFKAAVERSGPKDQPEWRVVVLHPEHADCAYFWEDDNVDSFQPHWIAQ
jgi:hypothetical protein